MKRESSAGAARGPEKPKGKAGKGGLFRRLFRKRFLPFTLLAGLLFGGLCVRSYIDQLDYAFSYVALNYAEASKGYAPNSTRFDMYDFKSDDLMRTVIEMAALKDVEPWELAQCVGISTRGGGGSGYISTGYTLSVSLGALEGKDVHIDAKSLLDLLAKAYKQRFFENSVARADVLLFSYSTARDAEYSETADYYEMKLSILQSYVAGRILENSSFRSDTTGLTFSDIQERIGNLQTVDLLKTNAYIDATGAARHKDDYLAKLAYVNYRNSERYQRAFAEYSVRLENIAMYDILQSAVVMVPTYDDAGEFYMSMTKTGVDDISISAQTWSEQAAQIRAEIASVDARIDAVGNSRNLDSDNEKVEEMLASLKAKIDEATQITLLTDSDYVAYKADNYITFTNSRLSAASKIEFTRNAAVALAFYAGLWAVALRRLMRKERKIV